MGLLRPVSFGQQRLWFLEHLEPGTSAYNLPRAIRFTGILDVEALGRALDAIVQRHESLRMTFADVDGEVMASVGLGAPVEAPVVSLEYLPEDQKQAQAEVVAEKEGQRPFDLGTGPLMRVKLVRLSPEQHILVLTLHHIIIDGWSMDVLFRELGEFYNAFSSNRALDIAPLTIQYSDFVRWRRKSIGIDVLARELEFWKKTLSGVPPVLELPADRCRPAFQSHKGRTHRIKLEQELAKDLLELSRRQGVTIFMTLLAAFETLLWRYTGVGDFVLGTPVAGRNEVDLEQIIGLFANTLPLRAKLGDNPTVRDLLRRVRDTTLDAIAHQDVPFEKLVEELRPERSMSHTPLFQVMFILQNAPGRPLDLAGMQAEEVEFESGLAKFDLTLEIFELDGLYCKWEYSTDLFDERRIVRMAGHFETLLRAIVADPDRRLSELPVLTAEERNKVLVEWNATECYYPDNICIHQAFEAQVERSRNTIAVFGEDRQLTYQQLNEETNRLANYLRKQGVLPQDRVGVAVERSVDAIVAILAVLKTGASYVPIDPAYPKQRIEFMLADSNAPVLITQHRLRTRLPDHRGKTVYLDRDRISINAESHLNQRTAIDPGDSAYTIYTSGSTGGPKGVLGTHRASMNRFSWMWRTYPFCAGEVCAQRTSLSFVDSICEVFGPLLQGMSILVIPDEDVADSERLVRRLTQYRVTRIVVVPSQLGAVLEACTDLESRLSSLRLCFTSGEAIPYSLYELFIRKIPHATLINLYGSSEVAADVTCFDTAATIPRGFVPIGKPIANTAVYILDRSLNAVPIGVPGEIYVAGDCLALGYLNRPELTAERFIANPFCGGARRLLYKTGDLGRYREDGNIEFLGRADDRVKVRGFRIELGEIESTLTAHESIKHAAVVARSSGARSNDTRSNDTMTDCLVAYVVPADGQALVRSELRRFLKTRLPDYMIPSAFVTLEALPLTPNGKLDQRALPNPESAQPEVSGNYVAPRNATEAKLVEIWAEVLKVGRIGVLDNFFELGGHSLMAARVVSRVRKYLGKELPMRSLFEEPTIAALAVVLEKDHENGAKVRPRITPKLPDRRAREQLDARLRELSDEEVDALLKTALAHRTQSQRYGN